MSGSATELRGAALPEYSLSNIPGLGLGKYFLRFPFYVFPTGVVFRCPFKDHKELGMGVCALLSMFHLRRALFQSHCALSGPVSETPMMLLSTCSRTPVFICARLAWWVFWTTWSPHTMVTIPPQGSGPDFTGPLLLMQA